MQTITSPEDLRRASGWDVLAVAARDAEQPARQLAACGRDDTDAVANTGGKPERSPSGDCVEVNA